MTYYYVIYGNGNVKRFTSKIEACKFAMRHKPWAAGGLKNYIRKFGYKPGKPPATVTEGSKELHAEEVKSTAKKKRRRTKSAKTMERRRYSLLEIILG